MPNNHNTERRHHIAKMKFKVTNWAEYDAGLRRQGSLTLWVTEEVIDGFQAAPRSSRGGQAIYSDLAIEAGLMLRLAFHLPLRQTEGLMACLFELLGCKHRVRSQYCSVRSFPVRIDPFPQRSGPWQEPKQCWAKAPG